MRPRILIAGEEGLGKQYRNYVISLDYSNSVIEAGGLPMMALDLRHPEDYAELADGLLLTGGPDLHCGYYGEYYDSSFTLPPVNMFRDALDFGLCRAFMAAGKPIFGIGRGLQVLNTALGGSLYQDIFLKTGRGHPDETAAELKNDGVTDRAQFAVHAVRSNRNSRLASVIGEEKIVNSCHHQAIRELGSGLVAAAVSPDGLIEAAEHDTMPWFGVQWHPERETEHTASDPSLFAHFTDLCREVRK